MRILFVYPNVARARSPQLGICMLAGVARDLGHDCDLYDLTAIPSGNEFSAFESKLAQCRPDLLAVSCRSNEWSFTAELFKTVSTRGIPRIFGGPHATVATEEVLGVANVAVRGEGEATFAELLVKLAAGQDVENTPGCWVRRGNAIVKNEMRDLIPDLDTLPFPAWGIFDRLHYRDSYIRTAAGSARTVGTFEGSRGCPYACTYCSNAHVRDLYKAKGKWSRYKSADRLVAEIRRFRDRHGLDFVYWIDEVLLPNLSRLRRLSELYRREIDVPFVFMERPENMTDEKVRLAREMGAERVSIGIESGDEDLRRCLLNRRLSQECIVSAFHTAKRHGLATHAFTMVGFPGEGRGSLEQTYELVRQARPDSVQTSIFFPLKGTKLYEHTIADGLYDPTLPMPPNYYRGSALHFAEGKKRELLRYQYLLTYYDSRLIRFLARTRQNLIVFRIAVLSMRVWSKLANEGVGATLAAVWRRLVR